MDWGAPGRLGWLAAAAGYAALLWWRERRDRVLLARLGEARLLAALVDPAAARRRWTRWLGAAALALLALAAARPRFGTTLAPVTRRGNDVFVALDVSKSMLVEDLPPSRLAKARRALGLLVQQLQGDRVGVIAFAGDAFLQCPLTLDVEAAGMFLDTLDTETVPVPGTALGRAVRVALRHFPRESRVPKILVLLTDGEDTRASDPLGAAREAKDAGVRIYTIGLGTPQGDVIKLRDDSGAVSAFKKDEQGETVLSRLDEATLAEMARLTGGEYARGAPDDAEIPPLIARVSSHAGAALATRTYRVREERYQAPLLAAIALLLVQAAVPLRRGAAGAAARRLRGARLRLPRRGAAAGLALLAAAPAARADWRAPLARGNRLYVQGKLEEARQEYYNAQAEAPENAAPPYNIGNTFVGEGKADEALKAYDQAAGLARHPLLRSAVAYNRGCALIAAGREAEAAEAFKDALRWNPRDADAKHNLEWVRAPKQARPKPRPGQPKPGEGPQPGKEPGRMTKEDAERILESVRDQEKRMREAQRQARKGKPPETGGGKDW